jgi:hypothetical protein
MGSPEHDESSAGEHQQQGRHVPPTYPPPYQPHPSPFPPPQHQQYPSYGPPPQTSTSGMAIASLVLGIVWMYGIGSILALVFGYTARNQIDRSNGWVTGRGMATAGIILFIAAVNEASSL